MVAILRHWLLAEVPLPAARAGWAAAGAASQLVGAPNFAEKADRLALCEYGLSGQLMGGEQPQLGSAAMFGLPPGVGALRAGQSALSTLPLWPLLSARAAGAAPDVVRSPAWRPWPGS